MGRRKLTLLDKALRIDELVIILNNVASMDERELTSLTNDEIKEEIKWCIERLYMDIEDLDDDYEDTYIKRYRTQIEQCKRLLNEY